MPPADAPILKGFRVALEEIYDQRLERVVLYGSRARGDARMGAVGAIADRLGRDHRVCHRLVRFPFDHARRDALDRPSATLCRFHGSVQLEPGARSLY